MLLLTTAAAHAEPLKYGQTYNLQNGYQSWQGGYLDTNGAGCQSNKLCVSTSPKSDRAGQKTGTWKIVSASGAAAGTNVKCGDELYLQNQYQGDGGYLDTNSTCGDGKLYCVSTAAKSDRAGQKTGTWKIMPQSCPSGVVDTGQPVLLLNAYNNWKGGFLETNGAGCQGNVYCVSTNAGWNRANQNTAFWRLAKQ